MKYRVSFRAKNLISIFTCENNMLSSHVKYLCYGYKINRAFHSKCESEMLWYFIFIGVYKINRTLHGHLEIRNFSSCAEKIFHK